jgi:hypothetical protein
VQKITTSQSKGFNLPAITAITVCILFALWSGLWFWASALTVRPETVINQWEQNLANNTAALSLEASTEQQALAHKMIDRLKRSITINPLDANSHLLLARYYEALANINTNASSNNISSNNDSPNQYNSLAEQAFKSAIKHQPSWDYAWDKLANFHSNTQASNDTILLHALTNAMQLGPYEIKSQQILIPLIFKHWPLITNSQEIQNQTQATEIIKQALKYSHARLVLNSAKKHQQLTVLAPLVTKQWHINYVHKYLKEASNE